MFPTTITLTISSPEQLAQALAAMAHMVGTPVTPPAETPPAPKPKAEKTAPAATAAKPEAASAPSQPTVEVAAAAAPVQSTEQPAPQSDTVKAADATSAAEFPYAKLAAVVNGALGKHGKEKLMAIAKKHGADTFKGLPASAWQAAHDDVVALGA